MSFFMKLITGTTLLALTATLAGQTTTPAESTIPPIGETTTTLIMDASQKKPADWWQTAVTRFRSMETTAPKHGTVLLGDSITARWPADMFPGEKVINRGIGSDHIGGWKYFGIIDRLDTSVKALEPERVFLMIGVNDMLPGGAPMENMVEAYDYLLDQIKANAPEAEIVVQSILPVSKPDFHYMHEPIRQLNKEIQRMAAEKGMRFIDLHSRFKNEKGELKAELTKDGVHLTPEGYRLWLDVLLADGILKSDDESTSHSVQLPN